MTGADASAAPPSRAFVALFFLLVLAALLFSDKGQIAGDGGVRWRALVAMVDEHRLTPDRYTLEMPLLATPLWAAGAAAARAAGETGPARLETVGRVVQRFNKLVAFAIVVWLFRRLRRLGLGERGAAGGVLSLLFGESPHPSFEGFLLRRSLDAARVRGAGPPRGRAGADARRRLRARPRGGARDSFEPASFSCDRRGRCDAVFPRR